MAINVKMTGFFVPLQNIHIVIFLVNLHRTRKQWAIAHENDPKTQKRRVLVMPLKHVLSVMDLVNLSGTPKLWTIAYENGPKMQKQLVFGHASQTCTTCRGPCKSLHNPKTVGNIS
jgi:hypothetical protein